MIFNPSTPSPSSGGGSSPFDGIEGLKLIGEYKARHLDNDTHYFSFVTDQMYTDLFVEIYAVPIFSSNYNYSFGVCPIYYNATVNHARSYSLLQISSGANPQTYGTASIEYSNNNSYSGSVRFYSSNLSTTTYQGGVISLRLWTANA